MYTLGISDDKWSEDYYFMFMDTDTKLDNANLGTGMISLFRTHLISTEMS